jgi:hypothetical protein
MKCMEVQELMELYCNGDLDKSIIESIEEHLKHCENCRQYYDDLNNSIAEIREMYENFEIPQELNEIDKLLPKEPKKNKYSLKRIAAIASIILIIGGAVNYKTLADNIKKIPYPEWLMKIAGENVAHSLDNGFGQIVELSDSQDGIKMTVHNAIIYEDTTKIIFSMDGVSGGDSVSISNITLKDKKGKILVKGGSCGYSYNSAEGKVYVSYEGEKINKRIDELTFEVTGLRILKNRQKELNLSLKDENFIEYKIDLDSTVYKDVLIKSIDRAADKLIIKYDVEYFDKAYLDLLTPYMRLLDGDKVINQVMSGIYSGTDDQARKIEEVYDIKDIDMSRLKLVFNYYDIAKDLSSDWKVSFKVDRSSISTNKLEKTINKTYTIGDSKIVINKLEATPAETRVTVKEIHDNSFGGEKGAANLPTLKLSQSGKVQTAYRWNRQNGKENETIYTFGPLDNFKDLKLIVDKAELLSFCDEEIKLTSINGEKQKLQRSIDGVPFDIVYFKAYDELRIEIYDSQGDKGRIEQVALDKAKEYYPPETNIVRQELSPYEGRTIVTSKNFKEDSVSLFIKSYIKIVDPHIELDLNALP